MNCAILPRVHSQIPTVTGIALTYPQVVDWDDWWIPEGTVPQATYHDIAVGRLQELLTDFVQREGRDAFVARDLAIRYLKERPQIGIDPDVCVLDPVPPDVTELPSLCLWKEGHLRPPLCIEVVSESHPNKDYVTIHERYACMHAAEVVVFDPMLRGPKAHGGPVPLQLWRRSNESVFERASFGANPAYCEYLGAWFIPAGRTLEIADDREGRNLWQSAAERERAEKERERELRLSLERRVRELERQVAGSSDHEAPGRP